MVELPLHDPTCLRYPHSLAFPGVPGSGSGSAGSLNDGMGMHVLRTSALCARLRLVNHEVGWVEGHGTDQ